MNISERYYHVGDSNIHATMVEPTGIKTKLPGILMMHGRDSDNTGYVERAVSLLDSGIDARILALDLGGHGRSVFYDTEDGPKERGDLSIADHLAEAAKGYETLTRAAVDPERIGVVGASYGGYLAVLLASEGEHPVKSLLLRAPAIYPDGWEDKPSGEYNPEELDRFRTNQSAMRASSTFAQTEEYPGQLWLIESEHDESIPPYVIDAYESASQNPTRLVIPGAPHCLQTDEQKAKFQAYLADWAREL